MGVNFKYLSELADQGIAGVVGVLEPLVSARLKYGKPTPTFAARLRKVNPFAFRSSRSLSPKIAGQPCSS
jgi:hypothetical protein